MKRATFSEQQFIKILKLRKPERKLRTCAANTGSASGRSTNGVILHALCKSYMSPRAAIRTAGRDNR